jgi:amidase
MDRRRFIWHSLAAGSFCVAGCSPSELRRGQTEGGNTGNGAPVPFELEEATVASLQDGMKSGKYTARAIAELYLGRIHALDKQGPSVHSVIETNPEALQISDDLDAERKARGPRGPLHGIPALIKDNIHTFRQENRYHSTITLRR